jgi:hypothetical protein
MGVAVQQIQGKPIQIVFFESELVGNTSDQLTVNASWL